MNKKTLWIARTALFLAIVVLAQYLGKLVPSVGITSQLVTGSIVNMALIVAGIVAGVWSGVAIGCISPVLAFLLGIGPVFPVIIPCIALGNVIIVLLTSLVYKAFAKKSKNTKIVGNIVGFLASAVAKGGFLWLAVVALVLPLITQAKPPQVKALSLMFSWPQMITAATGGMLALAIIPVLLKARKGTNQ